MAAVFSGYGQSEPSFLRYRPRFAAAVSFSTAQLLVLRRFCNIRWKRLHSRRETAWPCV